MTFRSTSFVLFLLFVLLALPHCLPRNPELECTMCPCPEGEGYICYDGLCIKEDKLSLYSTTCAHVLAERGRREPVRPEPTRPEPAPEVVEFPGEGVRSEEVMEAAEMNDAGDASEVDEADGGGHEESSQEVQETSPELPEGSESGTGRTLHQDCRFGSTEKATRCVAGLTCVRLDGFRAVCLQDCTKDKTICTKNTDGRQQCRLVRWRSKTESVSVCVNPRALSSSCDLAKSLVCRQTGTQPSACVQGTCSAAQIQTNIDDVCNASNTPPILCDVEQRLVCDNGLCRLGYTAFEGEECGMNNEVVCEAATSCNLQKRAGVSTCQRDCQNSTDCAKGFTCTFDNLAQKQLCYQLGCKYYDTCVFQNPPHGCFAVSNQETGCVPFPKNATVGYADICDSNKGNYCKIPMLCVAIDPRVPRFCAGPCLGDKDCTAFHPNAKCLAAVGGNKARICLNDCKTKADCPKAGMVCYPVAGGVGVCGWPP